MDRPLPLAGLLVVAVEQAVAAPFATRQLADLGARVIKVERPGEGDFARHYDHHVAGVSAYFAWLNRSKESVALDLKDPGDRMLLERLLGRADVFVQNLAPGAAERLDLSAAAVRKRHPEIIACDLSGFGDAGPYADRKAYDLLIQAETGVIAVTGTPDEGVRTGISIADIAGGMYLLTGVLTALYQRCRTGETTALSVSLFDCLAEWTTQPWYSARYGSGPPPRTGAHHASIAPYGPFRCRGGRSVVIGIQNEREWARFCADVLGDPSLAGDSRFADNALRVTNRQELEANIGSVFGTLEEPMVIARLTAADIAYALERSPSELAEHPQVTGRNRLRMVDAPSGPIEAQLPPLIFDGCEPRMDPIPHVGEHTAAIRGWLDEDDEGSELT